jgi:hypothetical protein
MYQFEKTVAFRCNAETKEKLIKIAARKKITVSNLLRQLVNKKRFWLLIEGD